jgi:hypothetical protein
MLLGHLTAVITVFGLCCPAAAGTADEKRQGEELIDATKRGDLTSVESLVQAGVNVNSRNTGVLTAFPTTICTKIYDSAALCSRSHTYAFGVRRW